MQSIGNYLSWKWDTINNIPSLIVQTELFAITEKKIKLSFQEYSFSDNQWTITKTYEIDGEFWMWENDHQFQIYIPNNGFMYGINQELPSDIKTFIPSTIANIKGTLAVKFDHSFKTVKKNPALFKQLAHIGNNFLQNYDFEAPYTDSELAEFISHAQEEDAPDELSLTLENDLGYGIEISGIRRKEVHHGKEMMVLKGVKYQLLGLPQPFYVTVKEMKYHFDIDIFCPLAHRLPIKAIIQSIENSYLN